MGWTYFACSSHEKTENILRRNLEQNGQDGTTWRFHHLTMRGSTAYAIVKLEKPDGTVDYWGEVILTSRKHHGEFGYKNMDEGMGPYRHDAPLSMIDELDRLAPNPGSYAQDWRNRVRAHHAEKQARRKIVWASDMRIRAPGATPEYFTLLYAAGPRLGWIGKDDNGKAWRVTAKQLAKAELVEEMKAAA